MRTDRARAYFDAALWPFVVVHEIRDAASHLTNSGFFGEIVPARSRSSLLHIIKTVTSPLSVCRNNAG